jgi:hypothetical protein
MPEAHGKPHLTVQPRMFVKLSISRKDVPQGFNSNCELPLDCNLDGILDTSFKEVKMVGVDLLATHEKLSDLEQTQRQVLIVESRVKLTHFDQQLLKLNTSEHLALVQQYQQLLKLHRIS